MSGRGTGRRFNNRKKHGDDIHGDLDFVFHELQQRQPALGIDPRLILIVEIDAQTVGPADETDWSRAGLRVVEAREASRVIAFSDDPQMAEFLRRLDAYSEGPRSGNKTASYETFFDNITSVRPYGRADRPGQALAARLAQTDDQTDDVLTVDVEVWHPGDQEKADGWLKALNTALARVGAEVHDSFSSQAAGVSLMRVTASTQIISALLNVDLIAKVDVLPAGTVDHLSPSDVKAEQLAGLPESPSDAPIVGLIDSGVQAEHPLLRGCVVEATTVSDAFSDGVDRHGHGTNVASVLLRGSIEEQLASGDWDVPPCRLISVRVLNAENQVSYTKLPQSEITQAVAYLASQGVKVINISLGDEDSLIGRGSGAPTLAAVLDSLARKFGIVFIVPTGNVIPAEYSGPFDAEFRSDYPQRMVDSPVVSLMDPAPSALSLTVGGAVPPLRAAALGQSPIGKPGWPSPFSRIGPGINGAIKPEVSAPAGTLGQALDDSQPKRVDAFMVAVADGRLDSQALVSYDVGTSLAAPHVARACAVVEDAYPDASANLIRALVLQSATSKESPFSAVANMSDGKREAQTLRFCGYGQVSEQRSVLSGERDTVLFAEEEIPLDSVHLYTIPIPDAFFASGAEERGIAVALCYDPPVRARRMDYLGSRMQFELLRGVSPASTIDLLLAEEKQARRARKAAGLSLPTISSLPSSQRIPLKPSRSARSAGANQLGRFVWRSALKSFNENSDEFVLAVQNVNRWDMPTRKQSYAIAVRLWVGDRLPPVYMDLRTKVRTMRAQAAARAQIRS
ncbi:S8 family peptidase [Streptomyces thermocarboxydus]|uniref:S8 family peptidase n=1 Tax=Streptomyces thermocarboxydus TaxID=59299 RepID=A0ABU3J5S6_9ACTN|nr:S8 family peptidase [Streptomyces thermocarboxydus]